STHPDFRARILQPAIKLARLLLVKAIGSKTRLPERYPGAKSRKSAARTGKIVSGNKFHAQSNSRKSERPLSREKRIALSLGIASRRKDGADWRFP
ncbi:hypothetical protein, partial [Mesorhizobium sp. M7A.F.Ca.CA.001.12.1.1]